MKSKVYKIIVNKIIPILILFFIFFGIPFILWNVYLRWPGRRAQSVIVQPALEDLVFAEIIEISDDRIYILLINNSAYILILHGCSFWLEQYTFFSWRRVPVRVGIGFNDPIYSIDPESSLELSSHMTIYRRDLVPRRRYRVRAEVLRDIGFLRNIFDLPHFDNNRHSVIVYFSI